MLSIVYIMIKHPWKCNYAATLSPEILHFQNFVVFFGGGKHAIRPPIRGQKNYLLAACLYFGSYRSPFFHTYRVDSSGNGKSYSSVKDIFLDTILFSYTLITGKSLCLCQDPILHLPVFIKCHTVRTLHFAIND